MTAPSWSYLSGKQFFLKIDKRFPMIIFVLLCSICFVLFEFVKEGIIERNTKLFVSSSDKIASTLSDKIVFYEKILLGSKAFIKASEDVEDNEWKLYVRTLNLNTKSSGVKGIGYAKYNNADGKIDVEVDHYSTIDEDSLNLSNKELYSLSEIKNSFIQARDSGVAVVSPTIKSSDLVEKGQDNLCLMIIPVYGKEMSLPSEMSLEKRRAMLTGYVFMILHSDELITDTITSNNGLIYRVFMTNPGRDNEMIYNSDPTFVYSPRKDIFTRTTSLKFGNQTWIINFYTNEDFGLYSELFYTNILLIFALMASLFFSSLLFSLATSQERSSALAKDMVDKIKLMEERSNIALEGSDTGSWDMDIVNQTVYFSPIWKRLLGYEDSEFQKNSLNDWTKFVYSEDRDNFAKEFKRLINKDILSMSIEYRMHDKEGKLKWFSSRGKIISWDKKNNPTRIVGTLVDITETKEIELTLQKRAEELEKLNRLMIGRELKMVELKEKINKLKKPKDV